MKKTFSLLLIVVLFSSCGMFRNVKKDKFEYELKTSEKVDSNLTIEEKTLDKGSVRIIDKGVIITDRKTIKRTEIPGANISISADLLRLKNGETIRRDSAGTRVSIMLDSLGQSLKIDIQTPNQSITETSNETITENMNQESNEQKDLSKESNHQIAVSTKSIHNESLETGNVEKEGKNSFWFAIIILGIVAIVGFVIYLIKKFK